MKTKKGLLLVIAILICFAPQLQAKSSLGKYATIAAGAAIVGAIIADQYDDDYVVHDCCFVCGSLLASYEVEYWGRRGNYIYPDCCPHNVRLTSLVRPIVIRHSRPNYRRSQVVKPQRFNKDRRPPQKYRPQKPSARPQPARPKPSKRDAGRRERR